MNTKRFFTLSLLFSLLLATAAHAQKGILFGQVTDANTGEGLIGATVVASLSGAATDLDGMYTFRVDAGEYTVRVSFTGYATQEIPVTLAAGEEKELNIQLSELENLLEESTITGTKFDKPLGEQTVSLDILRARSIENYAAPTIDRMLDKIPGVDMLDGQANIRGGSGFSSGAGSRVMLLLDDLPALQGDLGLPQWDDIPVEMIERVEVVKGAASALYGSAALNGIINVRTVYPTSTPVTKASTFFTSYMAPRDQIVHDTINNTYDTFSNKWWDGHNPNETGLQFYHARKVGRFGFVLGGNARFSKGFVKDTYNNSGRMSLKTQYQFSENVNIGVNAFFNTGSDATYFYWKNSYGGQFEGLNVDGSLITGKYFRFAIDPYLTAYDPLGIRHKFQGRIYRVNNNNKNQQSNSHTLYYGEYQATARFEQLGLAATAGVVSQYVDATAEVFDNKSFSLFNFAPYLQLEWKLFRRLTFSFGVRHEINHMLSPDSIKTYTNMGIVDAPNPDPDITEGKTVFRAGLNFKVTEGTYIRASFGQGYRFPTIGEKFIYTNAGFPVIPNPNLTSESGWSGELGIKQGVKVGEWQGFLDLTGFVMEYDNMTEFLFGGADPINNPVTAIQSVNVGNTRIFGFETSVYGQGKIGEATLNFIMGYTYINPKYKNFGPLEDFTSSADYNVLKYRFKHSAKADIEATFKGVSLGMTGLYHSRIEAVDPLFVSGIVGRFLEYFNSTGGQFVLDARISYQMTENVKLSFHMKNFTNELIQMRPAKAEAPRNWTLRMDANF